MTNVGALNYKVNANVAGFKEGMVLSRSELAMTRRAMTDSRSDAEKLQTKLDTLEKAYEAGVLTQQQYNRTVEATIAKSAEGREAAAREAETLRQAAELTKRLMTEEQKLTAERERLIALQPHVSAETYARAMDELNAKMPAAIAADRERADAMARATEISREFAIEQARLIAMQPHMSAEQYSRAMDELTAKMSRSTQDEKSRADAMARAAEITRRTMTDEERLAAERRELEAIKPHLSTEAYTRAVTQLNAKMPAAIENAQRLAREQRELDQAMEEGRNLTQSLETATESYRREMANLDQLLRRGAISQQTYGRAAAQARANLASKGSAIAGQIPLVGNLSSSIMQGAASFGPYGVAIVAAGAALYGFGKAVSVVAAGVAKSMETYDRQHEAASQLMVDLQAFQTLVFAGAKQSGATEDQMGAMLQKLQLNFAKAAQGNEKLRGTIQGLGLDVDQLATKDATVIFREVSEAIAGMNTPGEQMKAIFDLVGKSGINMADTFRLGAAGIDEMSLRAGELGQKMSEADAEQIAAATDAWNEMKLKLDSVWDATTVRLAPAIEWLAGHLETVIGWAGKFIDLFGLIPDAVMLVTGAMADMYDVAAGILTLDFDRIMGGLRSDRTVAMFNERDEMVKANKERGEALRLEKERKAAQVAAMEASEEMQANAPANLQKQAEESIDREIESLKAKNLELAMGKQWVEEYNLANSQASDAHKAELQALRERNKELEAAKYFEEEMNRIRGLQPKNEKEAMLSTAQRNQLDAARREAEEKSRLEKLRSTADQVTESLKTPFDKVAEEIAGLQALRIVGAIDEKTFQQAEMAARKKANESERRDTPATAPPSAQRGSREAYQLIAENARNERAEVERRHREAQTERELTREANERTAAAVEKLQTTGSV